MASSIASGLLTQNLDPVTARLIDQQLAKQQDAAARAAATEPTQYGGKFGALLTATSGAMKQGVQTGADLAGFVKDRVVAPKAGTLEKVAVERQKQQRSINDVLKNALTSNDINTVRDGITSLMSVEGAGAEQAQRGAAALQRRYEKLTDEAKSDAEKNAAIEGDVGVINGLNLSEEKRKQLVDMRKGGNANAISIAYKEAEMLRDTASIEGDNAYIDSLVASGLPEAKAKVFKEMRTKGNANAVSLATQAMKFDAFSAMDKASLYGRFTDESVDEFIKTKGNSTLVPLPPKDTIKKEGQLKSVGSISSTKQDQLKDAVDKVVEISGDKSVVSEFYDTGLFDWTGSNATKYATDIYTMNNNGVALDDAITRVANYYSLDQDSKGKRVMSVGDTAMTLPDLFSIQKADDGYTYAYMGGNPTDKNNWRQL